MIDNYPSFNNNHGMKTILLSQGMKTMVDDEDFTFLNQYNWCVTGDSIYGYKVVRGFGYVENGEPKTRLIRMHRIIMMCPDMFNVDHIDGNGLNNQKSNLRICSHSENMRNRIKRSFKTASKYKGVSFRKREQLWRATVWHNNKAVFDRNFKTEKEAALAYNEAALSFHGEFHRVNTI